MLFRIMFKGVEEPSTALAGDRIYEFEGEDIGSALFLAESVGDKKEWRVALIAEVVVRTLPENNWSNLLKGIENGQ